VEKALSYQSGDTKDLNQQCPQPCMDFGMFQDWWEDRPEIQMISA